MRKATYPKEGFFAFRSKEKPDDCYKVIYLAEGLVIEDHYDMITEEEYNTIQQEIEKKRYVKMKNYKI